MKIFTDEFNKIIQQMVESGHKNITIRLYPQGHYFNLSSEVDLEEKTKAQKTT